MNVNVGRDFFDIAGSFKDRNGRYMCKIGARAEMVPASPPAMHPEKRPRGSFRKQIPCAATLAGHRPFAFREKGAG
jgi:hypothetical protein